MMMVRSTFSMFSARVPASGAQPPRPPLTDDAPRQPLHREVGRQVLGLDDAAGRTHGHRALNFVPSCRTLPGQ